MRRMIDRKRREQGELEAKENRKQPEFGKRKPRADRAPNVWLRRPTLGPLKRPNCRNRALAIMARHVMVGQHADPGAAATD